MTKKDDVLLAAGKFADIAAHFRMELHKQQMEETTLINIMIREMQSQFERGYAAGRLAEKQAIVEYLRLADLNMVSMNGICWKIDRGEHISEPVR